MVDFISFLITFLYARSTGNGICADWLRGRKATQLWPPVIDRALAFADAPAFVRVSGLS
jgi:hypothetical protein